jgi:EAL domain-containing protein (putative c-di-GMP-specific phosphodiesterase class I)
MYRAKNLGRDRFEVFDAQMHLEAKNLLQMENDMRRALGRHEFSLQYQPIVSLSDQRLVSVEALVRWEHPARGLLNAAEFIPLAEETGLIVPIGAWVMSAACNQLAEWQRKFEGLEDLTVSVNLSAQQLAQPDLLEQARDCLKASGLKPSCLRLEIAESALLRNTELAGTMLQRLKDLGVQASVDDFGTGYSSLGYLQGMAVDSLKVDQSFVGALDTDSDQSEVVRSVVALARSMGLSVVAEGVESSAQAEQLSTLKCTYAQGKLFSVPLTPEQVASQLLSRQESCSLEPDTPETY